MDTQIIRSYETLVIVSNRLGDEVEALIARFEAVIGDQGGKLDHRHDWGNRKLAYQILKHTEGRFFLLEYQAGPDTVKELERTLRISDGVLRYLSIQQEHTGLPEEVVKEPYPPRRDVPLSEVRSSEPAVTAEPAAATAPSEPAADAAAGEKDDPAAEEDAGR
ncbi:MAG: 30S ribosomal protein S6 [Deltaproteobacteria bacterium]